MAATFAELASDFLASPQIAAGDVAAAAARGVTLIVNNRPDGEAPSQPAGAEIEAAAKAAGLSYAHIPVDGRGISMDHIFALKTALENAPEGKTLAFCRSGMRSAVLRAYLEALSGRDADAIIAETAAAGYDIAAHRPALESLKASAN